MYLSRNIHLNISLAWLECRLHLAKTGSILLSLASAHHHVVQSTFHNSLGKLWLPQGTGPDTLFSCLWWNEALLTRLLLACFPSLKQANSGEKTIYQLNSHKCNRMSCCTFFSLCCVCIPWGLNGCELSKSQGPWCKREWFQILKRVLESRPYTPG